MKIRTIKQKVHFDIHPDGDIYVYNKKKKRYEYIGFIEEEEPKGIPRLANKFYKALINSN